MRTGHTALKRTHIRPAMPVTGGACKHRLRSLVNGSARTVVDDSGSLAIAIWTCADCGELIEEIRIRSGDGTFESHPIQHTVGAQPFKGPRSFSGRH